MSTTILRWSLRISFLIAAAMFLFGSPATIALMRVTPAMSPIAAISGTLAGYAWLSSVYWYALPALFLIFSIFAGRVFCRWLCPVGTLSELPAKYSFKRRFLLSRWRGAILSFIFFASLVGAPLLHFLDPLSGFNRLAALRYAGESAAILALGLVLPIILLISFIQPFLWCYHLCPLGFLYDVCRIKNSKATEKTDELRRGIVIGLLGIPVGLAAARFPTAKKDSIPPILPPGAKDPATFHALCNRCYTCISVCPTHAISVKWRPCQPVVAYFAPEIDPNLGYCEEFCARCAQVCPTGAIGVLTTDDKNFRKIGTARIARERCWAWSYGKDCLVCGEFCSYGAIDCDVNENGQSRPIVNEALCRGCGACQYACPADGKAIFIDGVAQQTAIKI